MLNFSRRWTRIVRRQLICCIYTALRHPGNASLVGAFTWLAFNAELFLKLFRDSQEQIQDLLDLIHSRRSIIRMGNDVGHRYSLTDAMGAVDEQE